MIFYLIFIVATLLTQCDSKILRLVEGEVALLDFQYPCDSSDITLRKGYLPPFYSLAHPESNLIPQRHTLGHHCESSTCCLYLTINPVKRTDVGTYILTVYKNSKLLDEFTVRIGLRIAYPPGRAQCQLTGDHQVGVWVSLHCTAPIGTLRGHIKCYQRGMRLPHLTQPAQRDNILVQTFWMIKRSYPTFCCTSTIPDITDRCDCTDYVWDPLNNTQPNNTVHPCPYSLVDNNPLSPQNAEDATIQSFTSNSLMTKLINSRSEQNANSDKGFLLIIWNVFKPLLVNAFVLIVLGCIIARCK